MKPIDPRLLREAGAARRFVAATVAIGFVVAGVVLAQAALLAHVLAEVVDRQPSLRELAVPLAAFAATWPLRAGLVWAQERIANRSAVAVKSELRARLGRAVLARGPAGWPPERSGRVAVLAGPGLDALDGYFARFVPQLVLACLVPPTVLVVVAWSDWRSAVVLAVTLPLVPVFMVLIGLATRQRTERQWRALGPSAGTSSTSSRVFRRCALSVGPDTRRTSCGPWPTTTGAPRWARCASHSSRRWPSSCSRPWAPRSLQ